MDMYNKKIKNILEYVLIFIMFFIGMRKGGYYKEDSLIGVYLIFLISILYFIFNYKNIKVNRVVAGCLFLFSIAYFIPILIQNTATVSGAINIATRIYSMFLIYIIISNSDNKEKYIKFIIIFTIICGIFALDEISYRILENPLNVIGGGYVEENNGRVASIFQYSNLLGILCLVSILYLLGIILENNYENNRKITIHTLISFLTIIMFLTQSKMVALLYIIMSIVLCIILKNNKSIVYIINNFIYSLFASSLIENYSIWVIIISLILVALYYYILSFIKKEKYKVIVESMTLLVIVIACVLCYGYISNSGIIVSIKDYLNNLNSTKLRLVYYQDALKLIVKTPINFIFGMGGNSFRTMYETVQNVEYISLETHSLVIQVFLESGMLGLILLTMLIVYILKNSNNKIYKAMLVTIIIFAVFDVFLTYTFMLYIFIILISVLDNSKKRELFKYEKILNLVLYIIVFIISTMQIIAFFTEPKITDNLNNSLDEQENVIKKCETTLKFDPYDIDYIRNYTTACSTYLDILDIKKELYNIDDTSKRYEIINKIYYNVQNENKYEKNNKYAIEDSVYYVYKYLDELVIANYSQDIKYGYEYYLEQMLDNIERLRENHNMNEYAMKVYSSCISKLYTKYSYVNNIINSDKIENVLNTLKENEYISL